LILINDILDLTKVASKPLRFRGHQHPRANIQGLGVRGDQHPRTNILGSPWGFEETNISGQVEHVVHHSTLGFSVIKKKKLNPAPASVEPPLCPYGIAYRRGYE